MKNILNSFSNYRISLAANLLVLASIPLIIGMSWIVASDGLGIPLLIIGIGITVFAVFRFPSFPVIVVYPFTWLIWSYKVPWLGGQPERLLALLGLFGVVLLLYRRIPLSFPAPTVQVGFFLLLLAQLLSALINSAANPLEYLVSLITRVMFMYMTYLLIRTQEHLRRMMTLYIIVGIVGAAAALIANMVYGIGFFRTETNLLFRQDIPPIIRELILNAQFGLVSAWLLLGIFPSITGRVKQILILALVLFIFFGSFLAQFRREVLLTIPLGLLLFVLYRAARVQRPAFLLLLVSMAMLLFVFLPDSPILQNRISDTNRLLEGTDIRLISLQTAFRMIADRPILGWGPGSYRDISFLYIGPSATPYVYSSYNAFTYLAVEGGLVSLVGLLMILFVSFRTAFRRYMETDKPAIWLLRAAPVLMLQILIWFSFGNGWQISMPWFWIGAIFAAARILQEPVEKEDVKSNQVLSPVPHRRMQGANVRGK